MIPGELIAAIDIGKTHSRVSFRVKNGQERLVVLNSVARSVVESLRGVHLEYVFVRVSKPGDCTPEPLTKIYNTASAQDGLADDRQVIEFID